MPHGQWAILVLSVTLCLLLWSHNSYASPVSPKHDKDQLDEGRVKPRPPLRSKFLPRPQAISPEENISPLSDGTISHGPLENAYEELSSPDDRVRPEPFKYKLRPPLASKFKPRPRPVYPGEDISPLSDGSISHVTGYAQPSVSEPEPAAAAGRSEYATVGKLCNKNFRASAPQQKVGGSEYAEIEEFEKAGGVSEEGLMGATDGAGAVEEAASGGISAVTNAVYDGDLFARLASGEALEGRFFIGETAMALEGLGVGRTVALASDTAIFEEAERLALGAQEAELMEETRVAGSLAETAEGGEVLEAILDIGEALALRR